jgi:hypothetical protein
MGQNNDEFVIAALDASQPREPGCRRSFQFPERRRLRVYCRVRGSFSDAPSALMRTLRAFTEDVSTR